SGARAPLCCRARAAPRRSLAAEPREKPCPGCDPSNTGQPRLLSPRQPSVFRLQLHVLQPLPRHVLVYVWVHLGSLLTPNSPMPVSITDICYSAVMHIIISRWPTATPPPACWA